MFLGELTYPLTNIKGLGPVSLSTLGSMGIQNIASLLRHYPLRYEDRKTPVPLSQSSLKHPALTIAEILEHQTIHWKKGTALKVVVKDETERASMLCFGRNFLAGKLPLGAKIWLSGPFERNKFGELQSASFVFELWSADSNPKDFGCILPVYPLGGRLTQGFFRKILRQTLREYAVGIRDEWPDSLRLSKEFPSKQDCLETIHFPPSMEAASAARRALIFEELLNLQITAVRRFAGKKKKKRRSPPDEAQKTNKLQQRLLEKLPFELTPDQKTALKDIQNDMDSEIPMSRLIQGEVGSGKTLVAFLAALNAVECGGQAAFMAPTELLARQHADNAFKLLAPLGVRIALLTGNISAANRGEILKSLKSGTIDLVVGTHALFGLKIEFKNLILGVIDEQHRFGVEQRLSLTEKGEDTDVLVLTATPIPRTLAMTAFGDMDVSTIRTMPPGRLPVITHLARMKNTEKVYDFVRRELTSGNRAYFVYPLIEESQKETLKDAQGMFKEITGSIFPKHRAALIHSRIPEDEKISIMNSFRTGGTDILVATSVIEVGVDVPEATCMVIEHAERFGLAALHQLRGRVGRGTVQSYCFLVYDENLTEEGKERLRAMKKSADGFYLAEKDLKMRGMGDLSGVRQAGFLRFTIADPTRDEAILIEMHAMAHSILGDDPDLLRPDVKNLHDLLNTCPPFDENLLRIG